MDNKSFWLLDINTSVLSVSLVNNTDDAFVITAIGPRLPYIPDRESITTAVDSSLSAASKSANLPEDQEPNTIALILPPLWIGSDGKIVPQYLKLIEGICHDLDFKPMGFIANDEAIVEDANHIDSFPASFVLANLSDKEMVVSLTYLGKVIERISKPLISAFDPSILESALIEFKTESTLPPQIIIFGDVTDQVVDSIKNYSWVGKKNIETFLHFPDIKTYSLSEVTQIYTRAITAQFQDSAISSPPILPPPPEVTLDEVLPSDMGFVPEQEEVGFNSDSLTIPEEVPPIVTESISEPKQPLPKLKLTLPKFPRLRLPVKNIFLIPLILSPLLILIPFFYSKALVTLYLTPYNLNKQLTVTLDTAAASVDLVKGIIPVDRQTIDIGVSATLPTTGQKTVGNKATGEVVIFNQKSTPQKLPANTVLIDNQGNNYFLINAVEVASSSANLDLGVITLGQTKAGISASNIGPEYNLPKDTQFHFKDFPDTSLIAKVSAPLTGGSKSQISAVDARDITTLSKNLDSVITTTVNDKITTQVNGTKGLIKNATQIKKGRIDYSREVGEEADTLTATTVSTIYIYSLNGDSQFQLIKSLLQQDPSYDGSAINPDNFDFSFTSDSTTVDKIKGRFSVNGAITPRVDTQKIIQLISGKSLNSARDLIRTSVPRVYNFQITTNFAFLKAINPLPFRFNNITVVIK